jgi:hypothetical protein
MLQRTSSFTLCLSEQALYKEDSQVKAKYWIVFISTAGLLVGCSSTDHRRSTAPAIFTACVHPDQSKQFSYRKGRPMQMEQKVMMQRIAEEQQRQRRPGRPSNANRYDKELGEGPLYDELAELMETKQFCKEGYFELDSHFEHGYERIIGECNDSATDQEMKTLALCGPADRL